MRHRLPLLLVSALVVAVAFGAEPGPAPAQLSFWESLRSLEGKAFEGKVVIGTAPGDAQFAGKRLVMHVRRVAADRIEIPFHVGDDRSRTWVLTKTPTGLRLKHDHRKADGSEDPVTQYGGDTISVGSAGAQEFHADAHTAQLIPTAKTNIWTVGIEKGLFVYELRRDAEKRKFRVEFDLTKPVAAPPTPWGY